MEIVLREFKNRLAFMGDVSYIYSESSYSRRKCRDTIFPVRHFFAPGGAATLMRFRPGEQPPCATRRNGESSTGSPRVAR
ncbi:protein of unknown function [Burkholderia multivorans]